MKINLKGLLGWAGRRLKEPSTYVGIATVVAAVGGPPELVEKIGTVGQVVAIVAGSSLAAATTSVHPPTGA